MFKFEDYKFSQRWFTANITTWSALFDREKPTRLLEIGSYEGASACFSIAHIGSQRPIELHCIDTFEGGIEHKSEGQFAANMSEVEKTFHLNTQKAISNTAHAIDLRLHKKFSDQALPELISSGYRDYFDVIYVDGSHQAADVLSDAVLSFSLLRVGGIMIFDDYHWSENLSYGHDLTRCPKIAIDAFVNVYCRKLKTLPGGVQQYFIRKLAS